MTTNADVKVVLDEAREELDAHMDTLGLLAEQQQQHEGANNNPHRDTAENIGLGSVVNYPLASSEEAAAGVLTDRYLTPALSEDTWGDHAIEDGINTVIRQPTAVAPRDGVLDIDRTPLLQASAYAYNPLSGAPLDHREYQIDVQGGDYNNPVWTHRTADNDPIIAGITLAYDAPYEWRVRDVNADGEVSDWSVPGLFRTAPYRTVPLVISTPLSGGTIATGDDITWSIWGGADPEGFYTFESYQIQVSDSETFDTLLLDEQLSDPHYTIRDVLPKETPIFIRVRPVWVEAVTTPWSLVIGAMVDAYGLLPLTITAPADGGRIGSGETIVFTDASSSDVEDLYTFEAYVVKFATDAAFTENLSYGTLFDAGSPSIVVPSQYTDGQTLYVQVMATWDESEAVTPWSETISLTVLSLDERFLIEYTHDTLSHHVYDVVVDDASDRLYLLTGRTDGTMHRGVEIMAMTRAGGFMWSHRVDESHVPLSDYAPRGQDHTLVVDGDFIHYTYRLNSYISLIKVNRLTGQFVARKDLEMNTTWSPREVTALVKTPGYLYVVFKAAGAYDHPPVIVAMTSDDYTDSYAEFRRFSNNAGTHSYAPCASYDGDRILLGLYQNISSNEQRITLAALSDDALTVDYLKTPTIAGSRRGGIQALAVKDTTQCWIAGRCSDGSFVAIVDSTTGGISTLVGAVAQDISTLLYESSTERLYLVSQSTPDSFELAELDPVTCQPLWVRRTTFVGSTCTVATSDLGEKGIYVTTKEGYLACLDKDGVIGTMTYHTDVVMAVVTPSVAASPVLSTTVNSYSYALAPNSGQVSTNDATLNDVPVITSTRSDY